MSRDEIREMARLIFILSHKQEKEIQFSVGLILTFSRIFSSNYGNRTEPRTFCFLTSGNYLCKLIVEKTSRAERFPQDPHKVIHVTK